MNKYAQMTRAEAAKVRSAMVEGKPVTAPDAYRAIWTLSKRKDRYHIPKLTREVRERMNAILLFNLGRAIGT